MLNSNKTWKIIAVLAGFLFAALGVVYAYGALNRDVEHNTEDISKHDIRIEKIEDAGAERDKAIIEQRSDTRYIKGALERIERKMDE